MSSRGKAKRREQQARAVATRRGSKHSATLVTLLVLGAIVLVGIAAAVFRGEGSASPRPGAVWSPEHGHWH